MLLGVALAGIGVMLLAGSMNNLAAILEHEGHYSDENTLPYVERLTMHFLRDHCPSDLNPRT
jgi:hypothetical protein